jgi:hypothetical protein
MADWAAELVDRARREGVELTGQDGLLAALVGQVLQRGLEVEMTDHLGYERHDPAGRGSGNSRNGHYPKTVDGRQLNQPTSRPLTQRIGQSSGEELRPSADTVAGQDHITNGGDLRGWDPAAGWTRDATWSVSFPRGSVTV